MYPNLWNVLERKADPNLSAIMNNTTFTPNVAKAWATLTLTAIPRSFSIALTHEYFDHHTRISS